MPETCQIRLVISLNQDVYSACWVESDGPKSKPFELVLPFKKEDMEDMRWYLETYHQLPGAGDHARAESIEKKLDDWGHSLFDAVLGDKNNNVHRNLMEAVEQGRHCLLTIGDITPDILAQPWELMRNEQGPLAFQGVTIRRQLEGSGITRHYKFSLPLRVLLVVSRPTDVGFIDPRNSIAPLLQALEALPAGLVTVDFCEPPTLSQLEHLISQARKDKKPYHIVHFDGHGTYLPETGVGALAFEKENTEHDLVTGRQLGDLLSGQNVPLVLLEACRSSGLSDKPVVGSVAPALLESGVGSVIAFSHSVHIEAARLLVERFYQELAGGVPIGKALDEARRHLFANPERWLHPGPDPETIKLQDWFIPQLYQVGPDISLVSKPERKAVAGPAAGVTLVGSRQAEQALHGFPFRPMYGFHGRAMEMLELERAFRGYPAVLLSGMGGMGKTALAREAALWWLRTGRFKAAVFFSFEQKAGAERVVQVLGQALDGDEFTTRPAEKQWEDAVELFHKRKILLVWDNFESTLPIYQQGEEPAGKPKLGKKKPVSGEESVISFGPEARVRLMQLYSELREGSPEGRLLVTCRPAEAGLPGIKETTLGGLARPDSLHLLAAILDLKGISVERPGYEREEINALLKTLDDHPLSISLVAPHLKTLKPARIITEFRQLLDRFKDPDAPEARNRSLLASLEFSKKRLSKEAQQVLPYLAWFQGGVFEMTLLDFAELAPEAWEPVRDELVSTALVSVQGLEWIKTPYICFHPILPYAAGPEDVPDPETSEKKFISVYLEVAGMADKALHGSQPAAGMAHLTLEEANLRAAISLAFQRGAHYEAWLMAYTLGLYLGRAGRLREKASLAEWLLSKLPVGGKLNEASCDAIRQHAWSRFVQHGQAEEAIRTLQDLITRLETEDLEGDADPAIQIALAQGYLGRIYVEAELPGPALDPLQKAIADFEHLGEDQRDNLSAALGDLSNAYRLLGRLAEALESAERALAIVRELGIKRNIAAGLGQTAHILMEQQRYKEADERYREAFKEAQAVGDLGLQGIFLTYQGGLQDDIGNYDRAVEHYKQAIAFFQYAHDLAGEMQTCTLLANSEQERGHLEAAEAWYNRSRELANDLNDRAQLAAIAQNLGVLYQTRAEGVSKPEKRDALLRQAIYSVKESLSISLEMENQVLAAASYFQLGVLYRMLGELDQAEKYAMEALKIYEKLGLPEVYKDYYNLAAIARDKGDDKAAAKWQAKYEAKKKEVEKLRHGESPAGQESSLPEQLVQAVTALASSALAARTGKTPLDPEAAEALAKLAGLPPPLCVVGLFLQAIAGGQELPPVPEGLPPELKELLEKLAQAVDEIDKSG